LLTIGKMRELSRRWTPISIRQGSRY